MGGKIKILHLEDTPADAELVARELIKAKINPEILVVQNKAKFINALKDFSCDIILSDHSLGSFDSHEALHLVKKAGITVPFILITSTMDDEFAATIMKEGAYDYILKDRLSRLPSAIINSIEKHGWEERQRSANERLAFHIENTPLGFIEWDNELHIKALSKRAEEIFGWTLLESLENQRNGYSQVYEEDKPIAIKALRDLATGRVKRNTIQHRNITKDGRVIWCEWFNSVLKDNDGKVVTIMSLVQDITAHKAAEELLLRNEKLFRALIENSADMITLGNREGKLVYGSPSITAVLGYPADELINMNLFDVVHPDDIPELLENRSELLKNPGKSFNFQHRRRHKNGGWVWCEGTFTNLLGEPGINAIVTNFRDISEKKIAEEQKEFDRNNLDALINNTNDLMWSVDLDFNLITSNQPFSDILKFTAGHVVAKGDNVLKATDSPQQAEPYKKLYQRAFSGESFTEVVYNELPVDSWSEISYCPIRKGDEVIGAACHSRDTTEKIKAERQVIVNAKRFRALVENGADAVAILSPDGSPSYVSPSIQKVLGYTEEEGMSLNMFTIMHPDDVASVEPVWLQMLAGCGPPVPVITCRIWHKNGAWRWMEGILTNLLQDTSINGIVNNFRDITEKKLAGIERIKMVNDLMLRNAELEQFGYIISHNLRAPVANIIGASSVLSDPESSVDDKEILNNGIMASVMKLDDVVKDLNRILDVKGDINDTKETIEFSALVDDIKISINNLIDKYGIEIRYNFRAINEFSTFKPYLYSIFYNLISNSIKYRRQQTHTVIEIKSHLKKNRMELVFTDNGMGINLEKSGGDVFGLYKRFHTHIDGKGMGLFMVKTQVEALGGKIGVQSIENEGTVFTIEFEL